MKMKARLVLMASMTSLIWCASIQAGEASTVGVTLDYNSKYIWRGQLLTDDPVFQPGVSVGVGPVSASVWGNMDLTSVNGEKGQLTEVDYAIDYSASVSMVNYSVGAIYYDFPPLTNDAGTTELYLGLGLDVLLSPSVTVYYDIDDIHGTYVSMGIGHTFDKLVDLGEDAGMGLDLSAAVGWGSGAYNTDYWGVSDSAFNDLTLGVALPVSLGEVTITPSVHYVSLMDSKIKASDAFSTDNDYVYAGIGLSLEF